MTHVAAVSAAEVRRRLGHPVIDADAHYMEFMPLVDDAVLDHLEAVGGTALRDRYLDHRPPTVDTAVFPAVRTVPAIVDRWAAQGCWWGNPVADPRERATAHLPRLLYERLDELGIDMMLTYPSWTLGFLWSTDAELRAPVCRAVNAYTAELFGPYRDRLRAAAIIPMDSPAEAVAELVAAKQQGHTLAVLSGYATRPVGHSGDPAAFRLDMFGLDSEADYDPVWQACIDLGLAPVFHSTLQFSHPARSISNYVYNHLYAFAAANQALCKALFFGGVYRRFPRLRVGYLEGGVAWAASLLVDLYGHWDKRGAHAIGELDPARLDVGAVMAIIGEYGTDEMRAKATRIEAYLSRRPGRPAETDEFAAAGVTDVADLIEPLADQSFLGCEADDPLMPIGFGLPVGHHRVSLRPMLGTDVAHWDVPVMSDVLPEAYELLEDGKVTEEQFEAFTFSNVVRLHGGMNPDFFAGTPCEREAAAILGTSPVG